jgi:hypothetical protein
LLTCEDCAGERVSTAFLVQLRKYNTLRDPSTFVGYRGKTLAKRRPVMYLRYRRRRAFVVYKSIDQARVRSGWMRRHAADGGLELRA